MKNYIEKGDFLHAVLAADVKGGDLVMVQDVAGVAVSDGDGVNLTAVAVEGVFEFPKVAALAISQGKKCYFVAADKTVGTTASGNTLIGYAWEDSDASATTVRVRIG